MPFISNQSKILIISAIGDFLLPTHSILIQALPAERWCQTAACMAERRGRVNKNRDRREKGRQDSSRKARFTTKRREEVREG